MLSVIIYKLVPARVRPFLILGNRLAAIGVWDLLPQSGDLDGVANRLLVIVYVCVFAGQRAGMRV